MYNNNYNNDPNDSFEKEILDNRGVSNVEDDDVNMINPVMGRKKRNYLEKLDKITPKNFKLRRTIIVIIALAVIAISFVISGSFARMTNVSETNSTSKIEAGVMKLEFTKGSSAIDLENAIPQTEADAIKNNPEYLFTVTNTGNITTQYSILLDNNCNTEKTYKINQSKIKPDMCIPDKYIMVGLSVNDSEYKVINKDETSNSFTIDTGMLNPNATNKYKMKIWLALETPNDYNSKGEKHILYLSNLNIAYSQIETKPEDVSTNNNISNSTLDN